MLGIPLERSNYTLSNAVRKKSHFFNICNCPEYWYGFLYHQSQIGSTRVLFVSTPSSTIHVYYFSTIHVHYFSTIRVYYFSTIHVYYFNTICVYYFSTIQLYCLSTICVYYFSTIHLYYFSTIRVSDNSVSVYSILLLHKWLHLGVARHLGVAERGHLQIFSGSFQI